MYHRARLRKKRSIRAASWYVCPSESAQLAASPNDEDPFHAARGLSITERFQVWLDASTSGTRDTTSTLGAVGQIDARHFGRDQISALTCRSESTSGENPSNSPIQGDSATAKMPREHAGR